MVEELESLRVQLRHTVDTIINPQVESWERAGYFSLRDLFSQVAEVNLLGLAYDRSLGGQNATHYDRFIIGQELGRIHCAAVPLALAIQMANATAALNRFGADELKHQYLIPAIRGEQIAAIAVSEEHAGSDVSALTAHATKAGSSWIINGRKTMVMNAPQADWFCMLVRTSESTGYKGMSQIVVPADTPGLSVSPPIPMLGVRSGQVANVTLENVAVPIANTIGEIGRGFQQTMTQFDDERTMATYISIGAIASAIERTQEYLGRRQAFGTPLLANQYVRFTLSECDAENDILRTYAQAVAEAKDRGEDISRRAAIGKLKAGRLQRQVADTCVQFHGGAGYLDNEWPARFYRDGRLLSIGGGADEVILMVLAREFEAAPTVHSQVQA